ncbi:50S ribosomal protein L2, partial [Candidatus Liberibacter asiaticus]
DTSGRRQLVMVDRNSLHSGKPIKSLTWGLCSKGGGINTGRVTMRFGGGGLKNRFRLVDFRRGEYGLEGVVRRLGYDLIRPAFIALISYSNGSLAYILAP